MDPIFDRLGRLMRSNNPFGKASPTDGMDDETRAAFEDLEAELNAPKGAPRPQPKGPGPRPSPGPGRQESRWQEARSQEAPRQAPPRPSIDPALARAYETLGLAPGVDWDQINAAHRTLLKKHHPDRHAGNEALMKQATAQSQKINEAYQVLKKHLGR